MQRADSDNIAFGNCEDRQYDKVVRRRMSHTFTAWNGNDCCESDDYRNDGRPNIVLSKFTGTTMVCEQEHESQGKHQLNLKRSYEIILMLAWSSIGTGEADESHYR